MAVGLFFAIWGVKLAVIDRFGSDLPYWDQWAKEGDLLLTPWFEDRTLWRNLILPHNEHRIAPTLAMNLGLVIAGGQWDARVQCVAGAALPALIAVGLLLWALRHVGRGWAVATGALLLISTAAPIVWENLLGGFQSQFYFLTGFSFLALGGLLNAPALTWRWWAGFGCGLLALVSMGSGLLVAAPVLAVSVWRALARGPARRGAGFTFAAGLGLAGLGAVLHVEAPWHSPLHAADAGAFLGYWIRCLAWPQPGSPWLAAVIWLPWLVLLGSGGRTAPGPAAKAETFILAAGLWVLLQLAAVSYSRAGAGGGYPANRYGEIAALGLPLAWLALARLAPRIRPRAAAAAGGLWLTLVAGCVAGAAAESLAGPLPAKRRESAEFERHVQAFVLTDDYAAFALRPLPFPLADWLARILRRAEIRAVLPASVRGPLQLPGFALAAGRHAPPLAHRRTRTVAASEAWQSAPLPAGPGWWKIETSGPAFSTGRTGAPAAPTPLRFTRSGAFALPGRRAETVAATRPPLSDTWRAAYVRAGPDAGRLSAHLGAGGGWLALSEPVAVSSLSHRTRTTAQQGRWIGGAGLALWLIGAAGWLGFRRARPAPAPAEAAAFTKLNASAPG